MPATMSRQRGDGEQNTVSRHELEGYLCGQISCERSRTGSRGGKAFAGSVLGAPVPARRPEFRAAGTNALGAEDSPRYSVQDVGDSPKLPEAAPRRSPESWGGARNVPRNRAGKCRDAAGARTVCAAAGARWEEERLLPAPCVVESGASEDKCAI